MKALKKIPKITSRRLYILGGVALLIIIGLVAKQIYHHHAVSQELKRKDVATAKDLKTGEGDEGRFNYYSNLSGSYERTGDYQKALENAKKADTYITDRSPKGTSVNLQLARIYTDMGDEQKAREYYEKEIQRIKGSGNDDVIKYIQTLEAGL